MRVGGGDAGVGLREGVWQRVRVSKVSLGA